MAWYRDRRIGLIAARALRHALGRTLLVALVMLVNPFGVSEWSAERSRDLFQRLYAPHYDQAPSGPSAREDITVLMLDDRDRDRFATAGSTAWPITEMILDIVRPVNGVDAPKSLFIDLLMADGAPQGDSAEQLLDDLDALAPRCAARSADVSAFRCLLQMTGEITAYRRWRDRPECQLSVAEKLSCIVAAGGTPVIFADPRPLDLAVAGGTQRRGWKAGLAALDTVAATASVYVETNAYPVAAGPDVMVRLTPGAALFAVECRRRECLDAPFAAGGGPAQWARNYRIPLDVTWATGRTSEFTKLRERREGKDSLPMCTEDRAKWTNFVRAWFGLLFHGAGERRNPCPYINAIGARALLEESSIADKQLAMGGKHILLGAAFSDTNDVVPAPPYDALPGVFYHAMAADNLISRQAGYAKISQPIIDGLAPSWTDALSLTAIFAVAFLLSAVADVFDRPRRRSVIHHWGLKVGGLIVFAAVLVFGFALVSFGKTMIPGSLNIALIAVIVTIAFGELVFVLFRTELAAILRVFPFLKILKIDRKFARDS